MVDHPLKDKAIAYIRRHGYVTFVELGNLCEQNGVNPKGKFSLEPVPNCLIWADMSQEFVDLIDAIKPMTTINASSLMVYLVDGGMLKLPIAKRPPKQGYKEPHWAPITFSIKPEHAEGL